MFCDFFGKIDIVKTAKTGEPDEEIYRQGIADRDDISQPGIVGAAPTPRQIANFFAKDSFRRKRRQRWAPHCTSDVEKVARIHSASVQDEGVEHAAEKHRQHIEHRDLLPNSAVRFIHAADCIKTKFF